MNMKRGFTLVEMLVSVAIFAVVAVIALGALLAMSESNRKAEALKSVMNNLAFAMDSMTRTIRTGYDYTCDSSLEEVDCQSGSNYLRLKDAYDDVVEYRFSQGNECDNNVGCIERKGSTDNGFVPLTAKEVVVTDMSFFLLGSQRYNPNKVDTTQPKVTIILHGYASSTAVQKTEFDIQTTVTQRIYDL
jgi:prepilin-type N-terminal cleavage/methylation domain-containing protein